MPAPHLVAVCAGSDCAKDERKKFCALVDELRDLPIVKTKCMGVCHGPVAVVDPLGTPVVVERITSGKARRALRALADGRGDDRRLDVVTSGKRRAKAVRAAERAAS